ncbi:hypothetical protein DYI95_006680 [Thermaerobacter sp. PB12/4term]|uniref:coenzyme F420-0:L-glutamate ligase n=1 Tax=Thermaerobacter sp. PB12/4term TaxID=2293838 RepID=UPI000E3266F0|nr:coenzyme F420-0:L-glutamate ligase [Thermaerobacter sp. PB12/4term]QIA27249.1 hypothetical protein DYI95_006680 [Thermaerobacter sp. PB12/4term]
MAAVRGRAGGRRAAGVAGSSRFDVEVIRTEIITPRHDLEEVVTRYTRDRLRPGDVVAVSTKIVSITQGRLLRPEDLRPGTLARLVSRFIDQEGSCSSPYSLQAVIERTGRLRIALAFLVGGLSRLLLRRSGDFYRIAGYYARVIDDVMGTLPPFDKHIVLPPADPDGVAARLARALGPGIGACIIDANDLGKAEVVGASPGVDRDAVRAVMCSNPWGNTDQQAPLAILRPRRDEPGPGAQTGAAAGGPLTGGEPPGRANSPRSGKGRA